MSNLAGYERYWIETWGCQMNAHDSEKISGSLRKLGLLAASTERDADVVILNTCSVREKAEEAVFTRLLSFSHLKRKRPIVVGVTGCVAQQEGESILKRAPHVDFVLGTQSLVQLPEVLATVVGTRERIVEVGRHPENLDVPPEHIERVPGVKAYITIMEGCDNFCSFCIVPFTRGRERCRPVADIVREARSLTEWGFREVQLLGQNVNSYRDPVDGRGFEELLDAVHDVEGLWRIRFTSPHPKDFGEPLMRRFRDLPRLCPHMHLPAQSGSTPVLARMKRGYTREEYSTKVVRAREHVPEIAISTDLIVGSPGETEEEFRDTLSLMEEHRFDSIYSFKYSERPYTSSAREQPDDVPEAVKSERLTRLLDLQKNIQLEKHARWIGRTVEVLVEGESRKNASEFSGRSADNRVVNFPGGGDRVGELVNVRITRFGANSLFGETGAVCHP
ncbi:MAG TPA: tRNA (N6-isopentenyl adenosine(37)-C2)-methylthiotransferase MiaB [Vicinamibacteria bacterium]|nr:tRNA (N6-isopentenyl adenosine(37)-C2)-methylthiotransferase MiaB [Vicinamibacteria bacterium]